jgi:Domain of unknown function (DUF6894)
MPALTGVLRSGSRHIRFWEPWVQQGHTPAACDGGTTMLIREGRVPASRGAVPLYYFNVYNDDIAMDPEGTELADAHAARAFAVKGARSLASESVRHGHLVGSHYIDIVDENQAPVDKVRFDEAVDIRP